ncbi:hypothetical protein D3C85_1727140 [compost metagenome]
MPASPSAESSRLAKTSGKLTICPFVTHVFVPESSHPESHLLAVIAKAPRSLPACGSVSAGAPSKSPRTSPARYACCCLADPARATRVTEPCRLFSENAVAKL